MATDERKSQIFKNAWFGRFAKRENISDAALKKAIQEAERGVAADLGGHVIKQRIARPGHGKSGGYRTLIVFKKGEKAFFIYVFPKRDRENIDKDELTAFKKAAKELLALSDEQIGQLIEIGALTQVAQSPPFRCRRPSSQTRCCM